MDVSQDGFVGLARRYADGHMLGYPFEDVMFEHRRRIDVLANASVVVAGVSQTLVAGQRWRERAGGG